MNDISQRWPIFLRVAIAAVIVGLCGLLTYRISQEFVDPATNPKLYDTVPASGRAMMSVCSLFCFVAMVLAIANAIRNRIFTWLHGFVLLLANAVVLADAVVNAHPW